MLKDFLPSIKKSFDDRMTNPIVGAFTLSWCMANWKIFLILFFSDKAIEDKISVIEKSYTSLSTILYYPMFFTALYLVAFPWLLLFVQNVQEAAISRRKSKKIKEDVAYLKEKISLAEAESKFDEVKLKQQLMLDFEKKSKDLELEREKVRHEFEVERERRYFEFEIEDKRAKYEEHRVVRKAELDHENKMRELELEGKRDEYNAALKEIRK